MNYFVNENIFTLNSGTEFSTVKRLELFRKNGVKAKLLTKNYNANSCSDLERMGLKHEDVLNMYDYFQEIIDLPRKAGENDIRYADLVDKNLYHIEGIDGNESHIKHEGNVIGKVYIAPGTVGLIGGIEYINHMNVVSARDTWDNRGFKSSTQYSHQDGKGGPQVFFDFKGQPKIEVTYMHVQGNLMPTMYKLLNYKGRAFRFNSEDEMFVFFMNEICRQDSNVVLINDRPSLAGAVASVQGAKGKWQYLHSVHSRNNEQKGISKKVVDYLQPLFNGLARHFDGLITATEKQRDELAVITNFKSVVALPDTQVETDYLDNISFNFAERDKNKLICMGLISEDKGSQDIIEVMKRVNKKLPGVRVDFYGYASPSTKQQELEQAAEKAGLKNVINFKGYQTQDVLAADLKQTMLQLNCSIGEAFGTSILHGMSYGVPTIAYDVKYGIHEMIEAGVTGELVHKGSKQAIADKIIELLTDSQKWEAMSRAAFDKAQTFNTDWAWKKWQDAKQLHENLFMEDKV
ncbi:MAG: glycosyltransferase [Lactovum sp.]